MKSRNSRKKSRQNRRRGLSLIEVVISTLLVGLVLVGAMKCLGGVIRGRVSTSDSARAELLAQQLLTEIMNDAYIDEGGSPLFGPEESTVNRSAFDDVDDYHLWSANPPEDRNGTALPNLTGWQRDVAVEWVDLANPANTSLTDQSLIRITVTVSRNGTTMATFVSLRSDKYTSP